MVKSSAPSVDSPRELVLIGGGHSHVAVLKLFGEKNLPGTRLTLICRDVQTPYSGMLPGLVAGHYNFGDAHIDLEALCNFAGVRLIHDEVTGLDLGNRLVLCRAQPPVRYDVLSIDVGSTPRTADVSGAAENGVGVKPVSEFLKHWQALCTRVLATSGSVRIGVVGTGPGGVEILLAMQFRLRTLLAANGRADDFLEFYLFGKADEILPGHGAGVRRRIARVLRERGVHVLTGQAIMQAEPGQLRRADGMRYALDEIFWATGAGAALWLRDTGLVLDSQGFIMVGADLQSVSHPGVFAAGDVATVIGHERPKSGVFAVRQGKPLAANLSRALLGQPLRHFHPQREALALISTGDRCAIASRAAWSAEGRLIWRWKDWIDRRFIHSYAKLRVKRSL